MRGPREAGRVILAPVPIPVGEKSPNAGASNEAVPAGIPATWGFLTSIFTISASLVSLAKLNIIFDCENYCNLRIYSKDLIASGSYL